MPRRSIAVVAFVLSFSVGAAAAVQRSSQDYIKVDDFVNDPLNLGNARSLREFRGVGQLEKEKVAIIANRHRPERYDEVRTLEFDGLVLTLYFPARNIDQGFFAKLIVSKAAWELRYGLRVGAGIKDVEAALGEPDERALGYTKYCGDTVCGTFLLSGGNVTRVEFDGMVD